METQRTIKIKASVEGIGLHTGKRCRVNFSPSGPDTGINFIRTDLANKPLIGVAAFLDDSGSSTKPLELPRRSAIGTNGAHIQTVEHLMAALWGLSIDNIMVGLDGPEVPGLDGSAVDFYTVLKKAGVNFQDAPKRIIEITDCLWCEDKEAFLGIFPCARFKISYLLDYPSQSIGRQCVSFELDEGVFEKEIAPARTFCLKEEAEALLKLGLGKGANTKNTLVMDKTGPIDNTLRFPDECARHKVLDLIGDLYLLGSLIKGRIIATRSGHRLNLELVKKIKEKYHA